MEWQAPIRARAGNSFVADKADLSLRPALVNIRGWGLPAGAAGLASTLETGKPGPPAVSG